MIFQLVLRNLRIYFRDKASVFFSLLGVFIMLGLYMAFLGNLWVKGYEAGYPDLINYSPGVRFLIDSWIISGVVAAASITTTMGAFGTMVDDTAKKIIKDFRVAPIQRWQLVLGYILSSIIIGIIMSLITLVLGELYIVLQGGLFLSFWAFLKTLGLIVLSVCASSSLVFFLVSFIKSSNAFATASTLMGTLIGFFMGVYVAIGDLEEVAIVIKCFPLAHSGVLLRKVMVGEAVEKVFGTSNPVNFHLDDFYEHMGVVFQYGDTYVMPAWLHILILVATAILFFGLTTLVVSRRKAKD